MRLLKHEIIPKMVQQKLEVVLGYSRYFIPY